MKRQSNCDKEADLWFLADPDTAFAVHDIPLPHADLRALTQPAEWIAAQAREADALARAAMATGQLDMLVADMGQGAQERLALHEAEALSWAAGTPIPLDEIGRDQLQARAGTDIHGLQAARWAVRRLMGEGDLDDLRGFLGLHRGMAQTGQGAPPDPGRRLTGTDFDGAAAEFTAELSALDGAHPLTRAAFGQHLWHLSDLSPDDDQIEARVWAARAMATECLALRFVPMGQGGRRLNGTGAQTLAVYFRTIEQEATGARGELLRLRNWAVRAREATAVIRGDNPARIIAALMAKPLATTEMVKQAADISRDTAERLLARLQNMGLIREITAAKSFRVWAAKH